MTFITFYFYIFLAVLVSAYFLFPLKYRWVILLLGSLSFYWHVTQHSIQSLCTLIGVAFICWICGRFINSNWGNKKIWLIISLVVTAVPLIAIKEGRFVTEAILHQTLPFCWVAPVGISFFSLQLIAYIVDVYYKKVYAENNFFKFLLFASFFPQIIQGPIPRYNQLSNQLIEGHKFDENKFVKGFMLILWGFFLKMCIADKAAIIVNTVFDNYPTYQGIYVLIAGILYSFQLYADFLACTTLAQGISELFGIDLIDNFKHPYFSTSIKDFWRRWHISLSTWLRDYIYIPLGGNKKGKIRKYINLIVVFAVSGIWHGGGYKFLFWGLLHGFYQISGELLMPAKNIANKKLHLDNYVKFRDTIRTLFTFVLVMIAWIIFRADHLRTGLSMIKSIFTVHNPWILTNDALFRLGLGWKECCILVFCLLVLMFISWSQEKGVHIRDKILRYNIVSRWCIYIGSILFILIFGTYGYGFDPQAFIYGGF